LKKLLLILITASLLTVSCYAENSHFIDEDALRDAVPGGVSDIIDDMDIDSIDTDESLNKLSEALLSELGKVYRPALRRGALVIIIAIICAVFEIFGSESTPLYVRLCGCAGISVVCIGDIGSYMAIGSETLSKISDFSNALLPTLLTAGIVCGTPATAAAKYAASALFMDIFIEAARSFILPMIFAYTALTVASSAFGGKLLDGMCGLYKWLCTSMMIIITLAFTAYLSISAVIASGGDAIVSKTAKAAISMALPVIGSIISDASASVVAGAEAIRSAVGVFGLVVVLLICIAPFAALGVNYLILKAAGAIAGAVSPEAAKLIGGIGNSFGMLLALVGSSGIMLFISIVSCIKAVSA